MEIKAMYFSPTKTSEKIVLKTGETISNELNIPLKELDITKTSSRKNSFEFSKEDIFLLALPVYGGRIPEIVENYVKSLKGNETKAIVIAVYGNVNYEDALLEMKNILEENNFNVISAGAFIGEHSFTNKVATNRPDTKDLEIANSFGIEIAKKIKNNDLSKIEVKGNYPYKERGGLPPVTPSTNENCNECLECVNNCPTESINKENPKEISENCILCCECIKTCPLYCKTMENEDILGLANMLETNFSLRKEPELFI